jgi:hypothetical protein
MAQSNNTPQFYGIIDQIRFIDKIITPLDALKIYYEQLGTLSPRVIAPLSLSMSDNKSEYQIDITNDLTGTPILGATNHILIDKNKNLMNTPINPIINRGFISTLVPILHFNFEQSESFATDEYGHTLQCYNNCSIDSTNKVFGNTSLHIYGGYAKTPFPELNLNMFTLRMKVLFENTGLSQTLLTSSQDFNFLKVNLTLQEGGARLTYYGDSGIGIWDLASGMNGLTDIQFNTWYDLEIVNTGSSFISFVNGNIDASVTTPLKLSTPYEIQLGASVNNDNFMQGYIDDFELVPYAKHSNAFTPSITPSVVDSVLWFNLNDYTMRYGYPNNWIVKPCIYIASVDVYGDGSIVNPHMMNPNTDIQNT